MVVHAPTGAGKTFIFELLYDSLKGQAVFTVPTRALANDKLAEWRKRGWDVGIATGDLAEGLDRRVVVATLETQRARLLSGCGPRLLVIDEYQMLGDLVRGVHYELAIALAPESTQLLLLSGSVANPQDIVAWLQRIGRNARLISHHHRPVPLEEIDLPSISERTFSAARAWWPRMIRNALEEDFGPVLLLRLGESLLSSLLRTSLRRFRRAPHSNSRKPRCNWRGVAWPNCCGCVSPTIIAAYLLRSVRSSWSR